MNPKIYLALLIVNFLYFIYRLVSYTCSQIIKNIIFEFIILMVIIFNSIVLALDDPTTDVNTPT